MFSHFSTLCNKGLTAAHRLTYVTRSECYPASVNNVYSSNAYLWLKYTDYVTRDSMSNGISDKTLCHNDKIKKVVSYIILENVGRQIISSLPNNGYDDKKNTSQRKPKNSKVNAESYSFDIGRTLLGTIIWAIPYLFLSKIETTLKRNSGFLIKSAR